MYEKKFLSFLNNIFFSKMLGFFAISGFVFCIYAITWPSFFMGYEEETARSALSFFNGVYAVRRAGIGATILYMPFVYLGKIFFYSEKQILQFMSLAPVVYSALSCGVFYRVLLFFTAKRIAIITTLCVAFGSIVWPYSRIGMEYQTMFFLHILLLSLLYWKQKNFYWGYVLVVGLVIFLLTITKSYGVLFLFPTLVYIFSYYRNSCYVWHLIIFIFLFALLGILALFGLNLFFIGSLFGAYKITKEFQVWTWWEGFYGIFFSFGKSIFLYSPLLLISCWYSKKFYTSHPREALFVWASFFVLFCITAPFSYWSDETLSVRKLVPVIPLLHLPLFCTIEDLLNIKKKIYTFLMVVFFIISGYVQLINSLYPYWEQLIVLRSGSVNTLSMLRYSPQLSHLVLHHTLFQSFLRSYFFSKSNVFSFQEKTWMSESGQESVFININYDLSIMHEPQIFFFNTKNIENKKIFLYSIFVAICFFGWFLRREYRDLSA